MKLCWFGCGILTVLLALSLLCGMLTQRSTRDAAAALELALDALDRDETAQAVETISNSPKSTETSVRFCKIAPQGCFLALRPQQGPCNDAPDFFPCGG